MHFKLGIILITASFAACESTPKRVEVHPPTIPLIGTWELISATSTEKDSTYSTFDPRQKMIKIINPSHFAFFSHPIKREPKDSTFTGGGGTYTLKDSLYTEHLEYFNLPEWEGHSFQFVVGIKNDTLTQQGLEKLENLGIDRVIIEKYKRISQ